MQIHSHDHGKDEPGEGVALLVGKGRIQEVGFLIQLRGVPPASNRLDGRP